MTKNNGIPIEVINKKPFEIVQEVNNEIPSYEEFMKGYESDGNLNYDDLNGGNLGEVEGYGPCKGSLCGCSCYSDNCKCKYAGVRIGKAGTGFAAHGRKWEEEIEPTDMDELALKLAGAKDRGISGQVSGSLFGYKEDGGEVKFLGGSARGEINRKGAVGRLNADLCNLKANGVQARLGVGIDTGISIEDGLEVKAVGFGFTVGKQIGVSTPFGEVKVDSDDCIIQ